MIVIPSGCQHKRGGDPYVLIALRGSLRQLRPQGRSELYGLHKHENNLLGRSVRGQVLLREPQLKPLRGMS